MQQHCLTRQDCSAIDYAHRKCPLDYKDTRFVINQIQAKFASSVREKERTVNEANIKGSWAPHPVSAVLLGVATQPHATAL